MNAAFQELMGLRNRPDHATAEISGSDPVYSTPFRVAETGAAILGAIGVAVADIWQMKTDRRQTVSIAIRSAAAALKSFAHLQARQADGSYETMGNSPAAAANYLITQPFATKDGRWFLPHFGLTHLADRVLGVLKCAATPEAVAAAVGQWQALALEEAIAEAKACGGMVRENSEWLSHPHGQALALQPVVEIEKIGDTTPPRAPVG